MIREVSHVCKSLGKSELVCMFFIISKAVTLVCIVQNCLLLDL